MNKHGAELQQKYMGFSEKKQMDFPLYFLSYLNNPASMTVGFLLGVGLKLGVLPDLVV